MIRVRVELVPHGNESESREIAQMIIANDGAGDQDTGNYGYVYSNKFEFEDGALLNFPRKAGVWKLIHQCLGQNNAHTDERFIELLWDRLK
jgi:hypothetical protein